MVRMAEPEARLTHKQAQQPARPCGRAGPGAAPAGLPPSLAAARARRLAQWVRWLLGGLAVPLLRAHFYATESEAFRNTVLYYRSASIFPNHDPNPELPPSLPASALSNFSLLKSCNRLASMPTKVSRARDEVATGRAWRPGSATHGSQAAGRRTAAQEACVGAAGGRRARRAAGDHVHAGDRRGRAALPAGAQPGRRAAAPAAQARRCAGGARPARA